MKYLLEVCVDSVESAVAAVNGGADRLEVCSNLVIGGTTPGVSQFMQIRELCQVPLHVLVRPRFGDFLYTDHEFCMIEEDSKRFLELGADGIVTGCLLPDGNLDTGRMEKLRKVAGNRHLTLHRAFDLCADPFISLKEAIALGVDTILTSGQQDCCMKGLNLLGELIESAEGRINILVGSGVNETNIACLAETAHATQFHMSGKQVLDSGMVFRKPGVSMGIPGFGEYEIFRTDEEQIRRAKKIVEKMEENAR